MSLFDSDSEDEAEDVENQSRTGSKPDATTIDETKEELTKESVEE